jgi:hypothetical protein
VHLGARVAACHLRKRIDEILEEPTLMEILIDIHEATGSGEDEID